MNPLNYASLEASQRLHAKGIVLETDLHWIKEVDGEFHLTLSEIHYNGEEEYPAHSMAEVWRELPKGTGVEMRDEYTLCWIFGGETFKNTNPTDALIDLLIFTVEQRKEK
jgi:hypothetical protein